MRSAMPSLSIVPKFALLCMVCLFAVSCRSSTTSVPKGIVRGELDSHADVSLDEMVCTGYDCSLSLILLNGGQSPETITITDVEVPSFSLIDSMPLTEVSLQPNEQKQIAVRFRKTDSSATYTGEGVSIGYEYSSKHNH